MRCSPDSCWPKWRVSKLVRVRKDGYEPYLTAESLGTRAKRAQLAILVSQFAYVATVRG